MTEQPTALRLADELEMWTLGEPAAAELRRLNEETKLNQELVKEAQEMAIKLSGENVLLRQELERCKATCAATSEEWRADAEEWKAQRDALLEALKFAEAALSDIGDADREPGDDVAWCEARAAEALPQARAAIATVEGGNDESA